MSFKHIYLIRCSETAPTDGGNVRLLRTGQMFSVLAPEYPCTWLVSSFNHYQKAQRYEGTTQQAVAGGTIVFLRTPGYNDNLSLRRLYDHFIFGLKAASWLWRRVQAGELLIIGMPTVSAAFLSVVVARLKGAVPVVEVRDKWPDVFWHGAHGWKRPLVRAACLPMGLMVRYALRKALLVTAPSAEYKQWVQDRFRIAPSNVIVSPLGYRRSVHGGSLVDAARFAQALRERAGKRRIACFFGTVGRMFDLEAIVDYAEKGQVTLPEAEQLYFVFLGGGDYLAAWQSRVAGSASVEFAGWASMDTLDAVAAVSAVGLAPYRNTPNFEGHVPNKIMEYLAYGLPIVTCMKGEVRDIVEQNRIGAYYEEGNSAGFGIAVRAAAGLDPGVSQRARDCFQANFDAETVYRRLLQEVADRSRADRAR